MQIDSLCMLKHVNAKFQHLDELSIQSEPNSTFSKGQSSHVERQSHLLSLTT